MERASLLGYRSFPRLLGCGSLKRLLLLHVTHRVRTVTPRSCCWTLPPNNYALQTDRPYPVSEPEGFLEGSQVGAGLWFELGLWFAQDDPETVRYDIDI